MKSFNDLSIRDKLVRIIVLITAAVLLPSVAFTVIVDFFTLRQTTSRNLGILAEIVAFNSSAALLFEDPAEASRVLQSLQADPDIISAVLYDGNGMVFASYPPDQELVEQMPPLPYNEAVFTSAVLQYLVPVREREANNGWLLINYSLTSLRTRLLLYILITVSLTTAALFIAYFLSLVFQSRISGPILTLQNVARKVSEDHNYNLRAPRISDDEIGSLTQAFNDMLEQIAAKETALRISEERLRIAVEAARIGVWDWDLKAGNTNWVGSVHESDRQEGPAARITVPFLDRIHPDDRIRVERAVKAAERSGGVFEADFRLQTSQGDVRHIRSRGKTFTDHEGAPSRMVGVIIDLTDLRLAEAEIRELNRTLEERVIERTAELQRALNEIEAFNYSVSHDLRAPLRGINGFSIALLEDYEDKLDETGKDFLSRIVASCRRMSQLIDDLLELSRVTRQEMRRQKVDLSALARDTIDSLKATNPDRTVEIEIEDGLEVEGDPGLIAIVMQNLLQNAWKFTSKKERARIEIGSKTENNRRVFYVSDNGAGFDMSFADKLFGVFHRLHKTNEFEGTGIGLATVRRIVERHGGEVWATGALDQGATFYLLLESSHNR